MPVHVTRGVGTRASEVNFRVRVGVRVRIRVTVMLGVRIRTSE